MRTLLTLLLSVASSAALAGPKLYVFDCGNLTFEDVTSFGLTNDETDVREMFVPCYLVEHAAGRLIFDTGLPLGVVGQGEVELQPGAQMTYARSVIDQLNDLNLTPADIDYVALSHHHFDHAGAANAFAASTVLIQRDEHTAAFKHADQHDVFDPALYEKLADSNQHVLDGDYDVFGDRSVMLLSAPGHTPGHQVLRLSLDNTGPLYIIGDLYHFRASRKLKRTPVFNTDAEQTLRSMEKIEGMVAADGATLWIEHDLALARTLNLAPAFYD